jgi:UDP:flavonoid glycosyltransferase YjiC (YdhE family)
LPSTYHYISPLIARLDLPIPKEIVQLPRDKPLVYFAMGSSGQPQVIAKIIAGFKGHPYRVIAPVARLLKGLNVPIPDNVLVTDWLPAHKINPMADISVIHGGIGTVMTACLAGKPVVGVSMMFEQEANIDCLVRKGFAMRIRKNRLTPERLCLAIETLLDDGEAQRKAQVFQKVVQASLDSASITRFFVNTFGNRQPALADR